MKNNILLSIIICFIAILAQTAEAAIIDGIGVCSGDGEGKTFVSSVSFYKEWHSLRLAKGNSELACLLECTYGYWDGNRGTTGNDIIHTVGCSPIFRLQRISQESVSIYPYLDVGVGVHYISNTDLEDRQFSTHYQFALTFGAGIAFGSQKKIAIGYRFQHYSNAYTVIPNDGMNMHMFRIDYRF